MTSGSRVLSADVGGTKTLIRISSVDGSEIQTVREELFVSAAFESLGKLVSSFLSDGDGAIAAACLAVAGPADGRSARVTNLGWDESSDEIERLSGISRVQLVNDFFAVAAGIPRLDHASDTVALNTGERDPAGPIAILGAGTGLGEAVSVDVVGRRHILSSEGGHSSFAPRSHVQRLLLDFLEERYGHVSYERILSGPGLVNIFTFYCERVFHVSVDDAGLPDDSHKAARIAALASKGHDIASRTMETFIDIYGAEAGNLALKVLPTGGVYVCGGIAAKNLGWFEGERFLSAYADKGRMRKLLLEFPVDVVSNAKLGLIGATAIAAGMVG